MSFDKNKYMIEYNKKNYKRVPFNMRLDEYDFMSKLLKENNIKINTFIKKAIAEKIKRDLDIDVNFR